ncbi:hypothetical protein KUTeg_005691 [Tegillarca granosa]|uniref:Uncharacterized protein n=1 Tax=Tegillarca granosa TaxID=220873 RepID=A0ABQ9FHG6_TEGGR|nr:hypothetical protein KUTeg_005691 [Tegillarca granosa]
MREIGRLVLQFQENVLSCIEDCFQSKNRDLLIKSVKEVTGFNSGTDEYKIPSLALKIGHINLTTI